MGDEPQPQPAPPPPPAPNYAAATREGVTADIETLPERRMVEQAARLGRRVTLPSGRVVDFTGMGEAELAREQARINAETAGLTAQAMLGVQEQYGAKFTEQALKRIEEADPTGFKARRRLAETVLGELELGSKLTPQEESQVAQQIRGAQAARGNVLGPAASTQEVLGQYELGQKLKQQRLSNVAAYVMGQPLTAQYATLSGAQEGTAPWRPTAYAPGTMLAPGAGQAGAQFAANIYGQQAGIWGQQLGYQQNLYQTQASIPNPWMQGFGILAGAGSSLGGASLMGR